MRYIGYAILALAGGVAACSGSQEPSQQGGPATLSVVDNAFSPNAVTVTTGSTVTWEWQGSNQHSVTFSAGPSSPVQSTGTFQRTFDQPGTYSYFCSVHGAAVMSGTVTVGQGNGGGGGGGGCAPYCTP